jgi:hypothetical protein
MLPAHFHFADHGSCVRVVVTGYATAPLSELGVLFYFWEKVKKGTASTTIRAHFSTLLNV